MGMTNNMITINIIDDIVINIYDSINTDDERSEEGEGEQRADDELRQRFDMRDLIRILLIRELLRRGHTHFHPFRFDGGYWQEFGRTF